MIRVLLAEDQAMIREALAALLSFEDDFEVVATVGRGDEVVAAARESKPDVALLDIEMPGLDGLSAAAALSGPLTSRISPSPREPVFPTEHTGTSRTAPDLSSWHPRPRRFCPDGAPGQ
jgi:DNA-binding NarL/FixJ family response regulator